jgi:hypothetical protein
MSRRRFLHLIPALSVWPREGFAQNVGHPPTYLPYLQVDLAKGGVQSDLSDLAPYTRMKIGGVAVTADSLPKGLRVSDLGVVVPEWIDVRVIHRFPQPDPKFGKIRDCNGSYRDPVVYVDCPRPFITPKGDYLLTIISGKGHYGSTDPYCKVNDIFLYRSKDKGKTWTGPSLSTTVSYNQHAWVPLVPKGSQRIYVFGTEPAPTDFDCHEDAGIAFRFSDDDGYTWSKPRRIRPQNDPGYQGVWCMNMTETDEGAWLLAPQTGAYSGHGQAFACWLYVHRSEDQGKTWIQSPAPRPSGWQWIPGHWMAEGHPLALGNGRVVLFVRTDEGHVWQLRSKDDGKTWTNLFPTSLVHPDAPPMIQKLSDGKTLIALIHNRNTGGIYNRDDRSEVWISLSHDDGFTWTEPRFFMSTATTTTRLLFGHEQYCLTYCDLLANDGMLNIFLPHLWRQVLQVRMPESELSRLPTKHDLFGS